MEKKLMVAKSYQNWERIGNPFDKNGKPYTKVKTTCPRCGGQGIIVARVENGQPIPIPVDQGICYQCAGARYITKEARLYTPEEIERMEAANEKAKAKRQAEQEQKMKAEFAQKKAAWIEKNGFNENGVTYIYAGSDSYSIKEQLKEDGYRFDSVLLWHKATKDDKYADKLIEVSLDEVIEFSAWGDGHFITGAKDIITEKIAGTQPQATSTWIAAVGDKIENLKVQLVRKYSYDGKYGLSTLFSFVDENGNIINWWTTTFQSYSQGEWLVIKSATVKKLDEYKGVQQTVITRAKLTAI
jgi:hypothetical protein